MVAISRTNSTTSKQEASGAVADCQTPTSSASKNQSGSGKKKKRKQRLTEPTGSINFDGFDTI